MIIENKIDKIKLQDSMKLFIKYAMLDQTKKVKKLIIIGLIACVVVILGNVVLQKLYILIFGIVGILFNIFLIFRYRNTQRKQYEKVLKEQLNKYGEIDIITRKHVFDSRKMLLEIKNGENIDTLNFNFDNNYKLWIEENNKVVVIQFGEKPNGKVAVIYCDDVNEFKQYCVSNNINFEIVKTK